MKQLMGLDLPCRLSLPPLGARVSGWFGGERAPLSPLKVPASLPVRGGGVGMHGWSVEEGLGGAAQLQQVPSQLPQTTTWGKGLQEEVSPNLWTTGIIWPK